NPSVPNVLENMSRKYRESQPDATHYHPRNEYCPFAKVDSKQHEWNHENVSIEEEREGRCEDRRTSSGSDDREAGTKCRQRSYVQNQQKDRDWRKLKREQPWVLSYRRNDEGRQDRK